MSNPASLHVDQLRALMREHQLDAYIVPSADPHQTEYAHPHWRCRAWVSGFTGSAGTVVVLAEKAGLWTDGRYFIQAERELEGSGIQLFKMREEGVPELLDWLCEEVAEGGRIGVDGRLITEKTQKKYTKKLKKTEVDLVLDVDLISPLWQDRPALPTEPAWHFPEKYSGRSTADKLEEIRKAMQEKDADAYVLSSLYDIAWLFNLRGSDTQQCPLLTAYALVELETATLFADSAKVGDDLRQALTEAKVAIADYDTVFDAVGELGEERTAYVCENRVSAALCAAMVCTKETGKELTDLPKARKNETELANWEQVHEVDGASVSRFWMWLEANVPSGGVSEVDASDELERLRRSNGGCVDLSFPTISGYGANAAMMHYSAKPGACAMLEARGLYLVDSGGQYYGGTTDITRTFTLGPLTDEERSDYTLVLKGVIGLSTARFLKGAAGVNLDILARQPLWENGIDYKCGTGHGVGCYLNVHEGPQNISPRVGSDTAFEPGMIVTIEPGVYKEDRHGIRTENMVVVVDDQETESGTFYKFRTQTLCPIDTTPLKLEMLSAKEIDWLNAYHREVYERLSSHLTTEEQAWLAAKTQPIG